jgi:hypothetical protein
MRPHLHLFISRVGVICNAFFLYCLLVRHTKDFIGNADVNSIIITLGWGASFFLNIFLGLLWLYMIIRKQNIVVPVWLLSTNLLMLIVQFIYLV